jgi:hypothetical protein
MIANRWRRARRDPPPSPGLNIGQSVHGESWQPDGSARVVYRGTRWNGVLASNETPRRHAMYIVATRGSTLVLGAEQFGNLARTTNTLILPANVGDVAGMIATAMPVVKATPSAAGAPAPRA